GRQVDYSQRRKRLLSAPSVVAVAAAAFNSDGGFAGGERKTEAVKMKKSAEKVIDPNSVVGGGVEDVCGEDQATEEKLLTPWTVSVASGCSLLRDPHYNKGLAFSEKERDAHYLRGLLPPVVSTQELQEKKTLEDIRQYQLPLQKYMAMMDLEVSVPCLLSLQLHRIIDSASTAEPGFYRGKILEVLRNWPERSIQVIVVTDRGVQSTGMGIPVGKLALYTALGGVRPSAECDELLDEFMNAVKQNYGEKVLVQFEDFANHNAFKLLSKYSKSHLVFNDDIQGTAAVVLGGLIASLKLISGALADHTFLFLGAGEILFNLTASSFSYVETFLAGTGIAELIALEMSKQTKAPVEETRKKIWMVDSKVGLIVASRKDSLQDFKKPWAHEHEPVNDLLSAVKGLKPTILIGTSGKGKTFTKEVIEAMASFNEKPVIMALSNPTSQSECTAEDAYNWSQVKYCCWDLLVSLLGSPFDPVEYNGKVHVPGQGNNAYIFPGLGFGLVMSGAIRVSDEMLLAAAEALAAQVTQEDFEKGLIYPPFSKIRKISANIAASVAAKAYELGLATHLPRPHDLVKYAESCMYSPIYRTYR
ncbi:hypothetical protein Ancab_016858, partial [Ancistrocladus abbreviatus]